MKLLQGKITPSEMAVMSSMDMRSDKDKKAIDLVVEASVEIFHSKEVVEEYNIRLDLQNKWM